MIPRYTHPEMGRIWSDQRRYETWLLVETAAAEAMAAAGIVPRRGGARHPRARRLRHRPHRRNRADDAARRHRVHDGRRRERRAVGAVAALRHDLVRRHRHRAGAADARGVRPHPERSRRAGRRGPRPRRRAPAHADDRPHARRARRADDLRPEAGALVRGARARHRARAARARDVISVGKLSGAVGTFAHLPPSIEADVCRAARARAGAGRVAGHSARPPRGAADGARHHRRVAREVRARDPRPAEDGNRRGRGAVRQGAEGLVGDAAQAQPDRLRADRRPGAAAARQRAGGAGEHRALARARHLAFVGRARDPARQLHRARSHAAALHADRRAAWWSIRSACART